MERLSRFLLKLVVIAVAVSGNCFVCEFGAMPALAAAPQDKTAMQQCASPEAAAPAGTSTAYNDPGPFVSGVDRTAPGCQMGGHDIQPALGQSDISFTSLSLEPVAIAALTPESFLVAAGISLFTNNLVRAGPDGPASVLVGTTIKKE
jgi:hypothetical protein